MNFWTFLDRNAVGFLILACLVLGVFGAGPCAHDKGGGCHIQIGDHKATVGAPLVDAGAP